MLILARKENQSIMIGEDIEISILNIKGDHVKIGIDAPSDVKVYRKEVFEEIQAANIEAVK
ncbi:MAG TPA: carbon storage regulator CsrA, partial [Spirochaetota bacterium]|nr:carbon storage regulator CsrA [Spirochaetota bacterium]